MQSSHNIYISKLAQAIKCYVGSTNDDNIEVEECGMEFSCKKVEAGIIFHS